MTTEEMRAWAHENAGKQVRLKAGLSLGQEGRILGRVGGYALSGLFSNRVLISNDDATPATASANFIVLYPEATCGTYMFAENLEVVDYKSENKNMRITQGLEALARAENEIRSRSQFE